MKRNRFSFLALFALWGLVVVLQTWGSASAHDPGLSSGDARLGLKELSLELTFAAADASSLVRSSSDTDGRLSRSEVSAFRDLLTQAARQVVEIRSDGRLLQPSRVEVDFSSDDDGDNIHFHLTFDWERPPEELLYSMVAFPLLPRGHRHYLTLHDAAGKLLADSLLDPLGPSFLHRLEHPSGHTGRSFGRFLLLGIEHILFGYDHLLFLAALLVVGLGLKESIKVITAFTVAHSLTLVCATFEWISLPSSLVEPLIAASIVYVGLENLIRRGEVRRRWLLTFFFGLIHGLGFAFMLRDLGVGKGGEVLAPLLAFNLGVEAGQLTVAIPVLGALALLDRRPQALRPLTLISSAAVIVAGAYWFLERTLFA